MTQSPTISVIIPVYNDAEQASVCLQALSRQTVLPDEVIIVDNNSTDDIDSVVASYPGTILLHESVQGIVHARSSGFDRATCDILARLDADSIPSPFWVEEVKRGFKLSAVEAMSGPLYFHDVVPVLQPLSRLGYSFVHRGVRRQFLAGANMALRLETWWRIREGLCEEAELHEDIDLALHLHSGGFQIGHNPKMIAGTSARRMDDVPRDYMHYIQRWAATYRWHQRPLTPIITPSVLLLAGYPLVKTTRALQAVAATYGFRSDTSFSRVNPGK